MVAEQAQLTQKTRRGAAHDSQGVCHASGVANPTKISET